MKVVKVVVVSVDSNRIKLLQRQPLKTWLFSKQPFQRQQDIPHNTTTLILVLRVQTDSEFPVTAGWRNLEVFISEKLQSQSQGYFFHYNAL